MFGGVADHGDVRGKGCVVLLQLIFSAIPLFHLSVFLVPLRIEKHLEDLMM